jgi:hypothetical protein
MVKTTVCLPDELKDALKRLAEQRQCSEADLLREAVARLTGGAEAPAPRLRGLVIGGGEDRRASVV